jgi:hypothetical protein
MKGAYNGIPFESGHEKKFLEQCRQLGIKVRRSTAQVSYQDSTGKWHSYNPDFYWPDVDYVVEVKGSWAFKDNHGFVQEKFRAATKHFNGRYTIITERELKTDFVIRLYRGLVNGN